MDGDNGASHSELDPEPTKERRRYRDLVSDSWGQTLVRLSHSSKTE
jgi:hypothetical protein